MGINPAAIGTQNLGDNPRLVIRLVTKDADGYLPLPTVPGELVGWHNSVLNAVELYVANGNATAWKKVYS